MIVLGQAPARHALKGRMLLRLQGLPWDLIPRAPPSRDGRCRLAIQSLSLPASLKLTVKLTESLSNSSSSAMSAQLGRLSFATPPGPGLPIEFLRSAVVALTARVLGLNRHGRPRFSAGMPRTRTFSQNRTHLPLQNHSEEHATEAAQ